MVKPRRVVFVLEAPQYFKALKEFLMWIPEDIYVNKSALTDILLEYLLTGECQEELVRTARWVIEASGFNSEDLFIDMLREKSSDLLHPLREMILSKIPQVVRDVYIIEQIRAVQSTRTITMRLRYHEANLSSQQHLAGNGAHRETKRTH